ncbi:MAG: hypothetical protein WBP44_05320 [Gammaproteobacteria bacterium]|jgi:hypothetical protein
MEQPTPTYEKSDLKRVVAREFGTEAMDEVTSILESYGAESWQREPLRVSMACLKLANGDIARLKSFVQSACKDYRDIIAWAEYSAYMRAHDPEAQQKAIESDWKELQTWLHQA